MKKSWSFIALFTALAAGTASAEGQPTAAGTVITNVAEITYTPEATPGQPTPPPVTVTTPPVETLVSPVPSFTITPNDGSTDSTKPDYTKPGQTGTVKPCDKDVKFLYSLTNTGNVNGETYTLTNTPDVDKVVKTPDNIRYYVDTNQNDQLDAAEIAAGSVTTITNVAIGQTVKFFQVYDIPCTASDTDKFGGDPTGTRNNQQDPKLNPATPIPQDGNNSNVVTVDRKDGVVIGPKADPDGNGNPVTPAYQSPEGITITPTASDSQVATVTTLPSGQLTVTFTNTLQNTGNRTDTFELTQTNNFPAGTTIVFKDASGNTLPDADKDGNPEVPGITPGGTADIQVIVTLPAGTTPVQLAGLPEVVVTTTSQNDPTKSDKTTDIIEVKVPGLSFGDPTPTPGGDPTIPGTPAADVPGNPQNPVKPGNPETCTAPIQSYLPMEIANLGSQDDSFTVTGTAPVTILNTDGTVNPTPVNVPVKYYKDVNGDGKLDVGDTALVGGNTGIIKPGEEVKLIAVVDVPCAAGKQTITLNQEAKSNTNPDVKVPDTNDTITVGDNGNKPTVTKTVNLKEAKPGDTLTYTIIGKNTTNANVTKALVCDTLPANTSFVSFTATSTAAGTVLYSTDGGNTWSATAPTTAGTKLCATVDSDGNNVINASDILKPGETLNVTFQVKVK